MFGIKRSVKAQQCNGIIISGDRNQNISIHYGPTEARLAIPFKPNSLTDSIDSLLIWQSQLTPLIGRDETVDELMQWAKTGTRISLKLIYGEGGTGKTRLAFEVASKLREQEWEAGQLARLGNGSGFRLGANGTLLIIDYPEQQPERVQQLLQAIKEAEEPVAPLRILLLSRRPQLLDQLGESLYFLAAKPLQLASLDKKHAAWSLLDAAWPRLCQLRKKDDAPLPIGRNIFNRWLTQHNNHAQPLYILAYAINLIDEPQATTLNAGEIIQRLVKREIVRLEKEGRAKNLNTLALPLLKGLAAISDGITARQLKALAGHDSLTIPLPDYAQLRDCSIWQEGEDTGRVVELQPDLLAAALLSQLLRRDDGQPGEWLYAALDVSNEIESATSRLGRLMHDATQVLGLSWPKKALIEAVTDDLHRCRRLETGLARNYLELPIRPLALHVGQALVEATEDSAEQARLLNNLSNHLAEGGNREEGLEAIQRAVKISEQLAEDNFAAYAPGLAMSLNNLSNRLAEGGGLKAIRRAVNIYEQLAEDNFAAYGLDLAMSLNNLSNHLSEGEGWEEGLKAIQRAVKIREKLAKDNFAAYGPDLANSLSNLARFHAGDQNYNDAISTVQYAIELISPAAIEGTTYGDWLEAMKKSLAGYQASLGDVT